jgi:O-acetyl-ADP-ribose deacetylase (regulator of RNase III)
MSSVLELEAVVEKRNGKLIRLEKGDLTAMPVDAFVFYAREDLALGSGFGTAIQSRGGPQIKAELGSLGPIAMGKAVMTGAGSLAARHIIHACGPKFHEPDLEAKLRQAVRSALEAAGRAGLEIIAFPPMGAGFYGVPLELCATVMLEVVRQYLDGPTSIREVTIVAMDQREFTPFQSRLNPHA